MKYFVDETERKASGSTCYLEWQKGYHHDECWLSDSINIDGYLWDKAALTQFMHQVIKSFDYYDSNVISKKQWEEIVTLSQTANLLCKDIITEAIPWWLDVLKNMKCLRSVDCELYLHTAII